MILASIIYKIFLVFGGVVVPAVIDLFAGAGGLSLGASRAGFDISAAIEIDPHAMASHRINFPHTVHIQRDILNLTGSEIISEANINPEDLIGIIGGPPCQGFSSIGQGDVNDIRNRLFVKFFELVAELHPLFFVAENVPGIMNKKYNHIRSEAFHYTQEYTMLPPLKVAANEYGAPTTRTRIFFIGYLNDPRIQPFTAQDIEKMKLPPELQTTVKQALDGLPVRIISQANAVGRRKLSDTYFKKSTIQSDFFYNHVTGLIPNNLGDPEYVENYKHNHIANGFLPTSHSKEVKSRYAKLKYGQQDKISKSTRLNPDGFCPTLRAGTGPEKGSYQAVRPIHYKYARVITPREAARLQGFPDWYKLPDTIWHGFRQIGNSVSPIAAERVLLAIYQRLIL